METPITIPRLFRLKGECCGCGACVNICPRQAIHMQEDEYGFLYPQIDKNSCIKCQSCKQVCAFQNKTIQNCVKSVYAAAAKDKEILAHSASGGIFTTLANRCIDNGGIVFGAAFNAEWEVHHIPAFDKKEICQIQGSKYTQSNTEYTFRLAKEALCRGKKVLYSGTPCQISGLYGYLGNRDKNLVTIDIVCHGVPNNRMFQDYLRMIESKGKGKIQDFTFRDKRLGWGKNGCVRIVSGEKVRQVTIWESASSYLYYFGKGWIYRESCYECPYTCNHRPADLTLGDYWGIEKEHPDYLGKNGLSESKGISLIMVNTEKGKEYLEQNKKFIELRTSSFEKAAKGNMQLRVPSRKGKGDEILEIYRTGGWNAVDERYNKCIGLKRYNSCIKALIPLKLKRRLKRIMSK